MIINKEYNGNTHYKYSVFIDSLAELPPVIQSNIKGYLNKIAGRLTDSIYFSHGQVVDLEKKFRENSKTFNYGWIVPKYDLNFRITDYSIGIKTYYLHLRLDQFGQILKTNWPKDNFPKKKELTLKTEIQQIALLRAKQRGYKTDEFHIDFNYSKEHDKLCWEFHFPKYISRNIKEYFTIRIPWDSITILDEYETGGYSNH